MLNILRFVFVLATFEITLSRYLLVRVDQGHNPGIGTLVSELQSRAPHTKCWDCISHHCELTNQLQTLEQHCRQYNDDEKFPYKKYLVNCAINECPDAENEIDEICVDGVEPFPPILPPPKGTKGTCNDDKFPPPNHQ